MKNEVKEYDRQRKNKETQIVYERLSRVEVEEASAEGKYCRQKYR